MGGNGGFTVNSVAAVQHIALATATELVTAVAARQTVDPPTATARIIPVASDQDVIAQPA